MSFKTDEKSVRTKRWYSDRELQEFENKLARYRTNTNGKKRMDWDKFYKDEGVMTDRGVVCTYITKNKDGEIINAGIAMNELQNLIGQWDSWDLKRNAGQSNKLAQLDIIALQQGFKAPPPSPEENITHAENDLERIARIRKENDF